ncbi:MAG: type II toxin-antitoxin system PemK/MazF family toxin [Solirubrobacterales bacterium]|nr:type II toxin-antitoxin system PemK/MazF family toxin [Solirubrobacterales bacterium]
MTASLERGAVVWVGFDPTLGREQRGTRPALVVAGAGYLASVRGLVVVLPVTSASRGWPHHVEILPAVGRLSQQSFAMTEQPRTISRERVGDRIALADRTTLAEVDRWLRDFLEL